MQYVDGLIRTGILDFGRIHDFKAMQMVLDILRRRVGSPVSYTSIAEDIQVAPNSVKRYIQILESLYIIFRVVRKKRTEALNQTTVERPWWPDSDPPLSGKLHRSEP